MRPIDADALIKQYKGPILIARTDYAEGVRDVIADVKSAPTIEAEPVRRGKWLPHPTEKDWRVCSACRQGTEIVRHEAGETTEYYYQYCPWCGAKMER